MIQCVVKKGINLLPCSYKIIILIDMLCVFVTVYLLHFGEL